MQYLSTGLTVYPASSVGEHEDAASADRRDKQDDNKAHKYWNSHHSHGHNGLDPIQCYLQQLTQLGVARDLRPCESSNPLKWPLPFCLYARRLMRMLDLSPSVYSSLCLC